MAKKKTLIVELEALDSIRLFAFKYNGQLLQTISQDNPFNTGWRLEVLRYMRDGGFTDFRLIERGTKKELYSMSFDKLHAEIYR